MKTIFCKAVLFLFVLGIAAGCKKFLTEDPPSQISLTTINEENLEGAVIGVYEPLTRSRGRVWESHFLNSLSLLEETSWGPSNGLDNYDFLTGDDTYQNAWPTLYNAIGRANILLAALADNAKIPEAKKKAAIGEVSFVRALVYYTLVRAWGSVPMRLIPVTGSNNTGQPLEPVDNIYDQIISDFEVAEANLPPTTTQPGKATSGAAKVALADVYLTREKYAEARDKAMEVMTNAGTYGYALLASYPDVFSPTAPTHAEDVFSLKFSQAVGLGNFIPVYFAPAIPNTLAKEAGIAARGLAQCAANGNAPLIANWDDNDLRKSWNVYNKVTIDGQVVQLQSFPVETNYYYGKYRDPGALEETAAGNDFYFYRYADVLLIFAEAENKINGPTAEAYNAINQVRRRGYGVPVNMPDASADLPAGLSQAAFDDMVFRERGYEFMAEGKRWFDLVRTGRWVTIIPAAGKTAPTQLTFEIPNSELQSNPALK